MSCDVGPPRLARRDADHLGVLAGFVLHVEHADRASLDEDAGVDGVLEEDQRVEWIAVATERLGDEAVVGRIDGRREQAAVEVDPAVDVIDLVLVAAAARNLDDDPDAPRLVRLHTAPPWHKCERPSASEGAASYGLRGRGTP